MLGILLGVKMYEIGRDERVLALKLLSRFDDHVERKIEVIHEVYQKKRHRATRFAREDLPHHSKQAIDIFVEAVWKKYHSVFPNVRGVRMLRTDRDASEFLQTISAERVKDGKGWIEDNITLYEGELVGGKKN